MKHYTWCDVYSYLKMSYINSGFIPERHQVEAQFPSIDRQSLEQGYAEFNHVLDSLEQQKERFINTS